MDDTDRKILNFTVILGILAVALSIAAHWLSPFPGDLQLLIWLQSFHSSALFFIMKWATYLAQGWQSAVFVLIGGVIVWMTIGKLEAILTVAAGASTVLVVALKLIVGRVRPTSLVATVWVVIHNNGFPSGHALFSMVFLGLIAYFVFIYMHKSVFRMILFVSLILLIILIGSSRVYLGEHWPGDVLGGYLWGATLLGVFTLLDRRLSKRYGHQKLLKIPLLGENK